MRKIFIVITFCFIVSGCVTPQPHNVKNICSIFHQYPRWYWTAKRSQDKWGVPVSVQMAIIYQESRFVAKAKPPHEHLLGFIPWFTHESSSYGYTQALKPTWERYERETGDDGSRDTFSSATNFIGWFGYRAHRKLGIPRNNAYALYLTYHEGIKGYRDRTYWRKRWLMRVAKKVQRRAEIYQWQLNRCKDSIKKHHWWDIF